MILFTYLLLVYEARLRQPRCESRRSKEGSIGITAKNTKFAKIDGLVL